jgi:hypothetical protein
LERIFLLDGVNRFVCLLFFAFAVSNHDIVYIEEDNDTLLDPATWLMGHRLEPCVTQHGHEVSLPF